jgi:hypothetical protein
MTRLSCHRFRSNAVRLWLSLLAYNLGNLWRRLVLPGSIRQLVADEFTSAAGEDRGQADQTCAVLLAAPGREPTDAAAVRGDGAQDCRLTGGDRVEAVGKRNQGKRRQGPEGCAWNLLQYGTCRF